MARKMRFLEDMNTNITRTFIFAAALLAAPLLQGQIAEAAPSQKAPEPQAVAAAHPQTQKLEWKSEEAKKRLSGQPVEKAAVGKAIAPRSSDGPSALRLIVAFVIMGGLLYGLYVFLRRFGKKISGQETSGVKVISFLKIDSRNRLAVVQFHEEELLLSINSNGGISLLSKCSQIELAEAEGNAGRLDDGIPDTDGELDFASSVVKTVKEGLK